MFLACKSKQRRMLCCIKHKKAGDGSARKDEPFYWDGLAYPAVSLNALLPKAATGDAFNQNPSWSSLQKLAAERPWWEFLWVTPVDRTCWPHFFFFFCITQGICVVHNFKGTHGAPSKPKPEDPRGMPLMAFPRVESPLETLSAQVL